MLKKKIYAVSYSGGKDSTATLLWMLENYSHKGEIVPYFSDTGWEHPLTYEYVDYVEKRIGKKIHRIKSKKYPDGFKQLVIERKMFPCRIVRFCTQELKLYPSMDFLSGLMNDGKNVVNVTGVRREESRARSGEGLWKTTFMSRSGLSRKYYSRALRVTVFQPIVNWTEEQVYDYIASKGLKMNPLYYKGFKRVGCYPCVMCSQTEMRMVEKERIDEISELEKSVWRVGGNKAVFWHKGFGEMKTIEERIKEIGEYNPLGFDLGCINHLGKCE